MRGRKASTIITHGFSSTLTVTCQKAMAHNFCMNWKMKGEEEIVFSAFLNKLFTGQCGFFKLNLIMVGVEYVKDFFLQEMRFGCFY
jgi:hypothetical protein